MAADSGIVPLSRTGRWALLAALQRRLDDGDAGLYEALLAYHAVRALFPETGTEGLEHVNTGGAWAAVLRERLRRLADAEKELAEPGSADHWLTVWRGLSAVSRLVAPLQVAAVLKAARSGRWEKGTVHYTRTRLRGRLARALEDIPDRVTLADLPRLGGALNTVRQVNEELAGAPWELLVDAQREEHHKLAEILTTLLKILYTAWSEAAAALREQREYDLPASLREVRDQLRGAVGGESMFSMLLTNFFKLDEV